MSTQWVSVDQARLVPARDEATCSRFAAAVRDARGLSLSSRGTLHEIRDCTAGQPQAAKPEPGDGGRPQTWCWSHSREFWKCVEDDERESPCSPDTIPRRSDPTGEAGIGRDDASTHYREHLRDMATVVLAVDRMKARAQLYPSQPMKPETVADLGDDWCISCFRDAGHLEPVALRPGTGLARKAGRCRWCLDFEQAEKFLPPLNLLQMKHRGVRITEGMVDAARKSHRSSTPTRTANRKTKKMRGKS